MDVWQLHSSCGNTLFLVVLGQRRNAWTGMEKPCQGKAGRACVLLPLWVEIHDAHYHDFLAWPHASFDVPTERDNLEKDCRESK